MGQTRKRHEGGSHRTHVKRGDEVLVLSGRSVGERGRVTNVDPQRERALVEGVHLVTKHQKAQGYQSQAAQQQQSGRIEKAAPIHLSNLMVVCPGCGSPTRVGHKDEGGKTVRACKKCGESLERSQQ